MRRTSSVLFRLVAVLVLLGAMMMTGPLHKPPPQPIRIGVLHSLTGTMAVSEAPLVDAIRLAVEEINADGGLLGRPVDMVVVDGRSDWNVFAREAERLIERERVSVLFACWTSACRKAVKPVVERHDHLMFYSVQYEGLEQSPNIVYTNSAPNQQIVPGTHWALERFGKRVYLIGSDYVFPRIANVMIRDLVNADEGQILAERYLPLGGYGDVAAVVDEIERLRPDVVLNTLNGDSNAAFFAQLLEAGLADLPILSFSLTESEMGILQGDRFNRHFSVRSYFQSIDSPENRRFVERFKSRFGAERTIGDATESSYVAVKLWAKSVLAAQSYQPKRVNQSVVRQSIDGPSAIASVDPMTRHVWNMVRIGRVLPGGQFEQVYATERPLRPSPWPFYRSREAWLDLVGQFERDASGVSEKDEKE
ncbi:MAG: urea ABC transporter substrate-binding protein [Methylomicrobium sp.]